MVVIDTNEEESVGRSGSPGGCSVLRCQDISKASGCALRVADFDQSPNNGSDHVFEEPIGIDLDAETIFQVRQRQLL